MDLSVLPREFFLEDTQTVARNLLGRCLVHETPGGRLVCRICETEAYTGQSDKACHAHKGDPKGRTRVMYGEGGRAYLFLIYGMYWCFNVVTRQEGEPEAVLIRAAEPAEGFEGLPPKKAARLLAGPGKLCRAMGLDGSCYGLPLTTGRTLWIGAGTPPKPEEIAATPRINVDYAGEDSLLPYRFVIRDSPSLSRK